MKAIFCLTYSSFLGLYYKIKSKVVDEKGKQTWDEFILFGAHHPSLDSTSYC